MFQRTGSARIQYSRRFTALLVATSVDRAAPASRSAAATFGGTATSVARLSKSAPRSRSTRYREVIKIEGEDWERRLARVREELKTPS